MRNCHHSSANVTLARASILIFAWVLAVHGYAHAAPPEGPRGNDKSRAAVGMTKLRVSRNHRYLENADGRPFFLVHINPKAHHALVDGLKEAGDTHLMTV